jgi:hypothetical protein
MTLLSTYLLKKLRRNRFDSHTQFLENSLGVTGEIAGIRYGVGHPKVPASQNVKSLRCGSSWVCARHERETAVAAETENLTSPLEVEADMDPDDTLILLFMCCHPALSPSSAIALMLRAVGGLTTAEIANAFLVPEATMGQRISRAKQTIKTSGVPFRLPSPHERTGDCPQFCTCSI